MCLSGIKKFLLSKVNDLDIVCWWLDNLYYVGGCKCYIKCVNLFKWI